MFYRFQYEVRFQFNDAISARRTYAKRARLKPATFVGRAAGEFKVKALNYDEARFIADEELSATAWGVRSMKGKAGDARTRIIGSEVLIDGNWYDTSLVCQDCLNGVPHEHGERLYSGEGNTGGNYVRVELAA